MAVASAFYDPAACAAPSVRHSASSNSRSGAANVVPTWR